jgi:hypothetical protein
VKTLPEIIIKATLISYFKRSPHTKTIKYVLARRKNGNQFIESYGIEDFSPKYKRNTPEIGPKTLELP